MIHLIIAQSTITPTTAAATIRFSSSGCSTCLMRAATCHAGRIGHRHDPAAIRSSCASERPKKAFTSLRDRPRSPITRRTASFHATSIALGSPSIVPRRSPPAHEGDSSLMILSGSRSRSVAQRSKRCCRSLGDMVSAGAQRLASVRKGCDHKVADRFGGLMGFPTPWYRHW